MEKKRHRKFVKFVKDCYPFKEGEIGVIVESRRMFADSPGGGQGRIEKRAANVQSLNGQKERHVVEHRDYIRIEVTPVLDVLYGKYNK